MLFPSTSAHLFSDLMRSEILWHSSLASKTLEFCELVTEKYSFDQVLKGVLKRIAWHLCYPELMNEEAASIDEGFKRELVSFLTCGTAVPSFVERSDTFVERIQAKIRSFGAQ